MVEVGDLTADDPEEIDIEAFVLDLLIQKTVKAEGGGKAAAGHRGTGLRVKAEMGEEEASGPLIVLPKQGGRFVPIHSGRKRKHIKSSRMSNSRFWNNMSSPLTTR